MYLSSGSGASAQIGYLLLSDTANYPGMSR